MRIIKSYNVNVSFGEVSIKLPRAATILHWSLAPEGLILVCLVDSGDETEVRRFVIAAMGQQVEDGLKYLTTLEHRQEVPIPMGTIIPAGIRAEHAKALQIAWINVFEKINIPDLKLVA
jgi:hypothetical protein